MNIDLECLEINIHVAHRQCLYQIDSTEIGAVRAVFRAFTKQQLRHTKVSQRHHRGW